MDLATLLKNNEKQKAAFKQNSLFTHLHDREKFLDALQIWSDAFQEMVVKRANLSQGPFLTIAQEHLEEEFGHNELLAKDRTRRECADQDLKELCQWFPTIISQLNDLEKTVLVHLVVEGCASVFYEKITPLFKGHPKEDHFIEHLHADANHDQMGLDLLENLDVKTYLELIRIQEEGWLRINRLMARIGQLCKDLSI